MRKKDIVYLLSDSVGETAEFVVKAVAKQFVGGDLEICQNSYVDKGSDIEEIITEAKEMNSIIAYTLVTDSLKDYRPYERESPLLQGWDDSEVEPGMSSDMSKVRLFSFS